MGDWMQFDQLKRRKFITLLGGAAMSRPLAARSQQADRMPLIGVLIGYAEDDPEVKARLAAFRAGLAKRGWLEGRNVQIEYRFAAGSSNQHASFAKELIALRPDVILAHSTPVTAALQQETQRFRSSSSTCPIRSARASLPAWPTPAGTLRAFCSMRRA
jgi:putative ABC transport system substrate-binding protein